VKKISYAQSRINKIKEDIISDHNAGGSIRFLSRKYEVSKEVIRRNLVEWGCISSEKNTNKINNPNATFGREK
jgi:Mor family transcriptional regulator